MDKPKGYWNKYNVKSPRPPDGREGSLYYGILYEKYGKEKADKIYLEFKYQSNHGH